MSIWRSPRTLAELNAGRENTLIHHLDIVFTAIGPDFVSATMPVDDRTRQPYGLLHGGASVVLAETIGSTGASMCIEYDKFFCVGQEINANHVRAVRSGRVTGTARAAHLGGRSHVWTIDILNEQTELVCIARITMAVVKRGALAPSPAPHQ